MAKTIDIAEIAKMNPRVNVDDVNKAREAIKALRDQGRTKTGYNLVLPFSRDHSARKRDSDPKADSPTRYSRR